ncbi:inorganic diphosphatase [Blautia hominis]|uniref:Inorganic diphosphatase n=1 Tax=Blautia hominis TaxID=2025493 RepID=A0ABQ0BD00_9FIRM
MNIYMKDDNNNILGKNVKVIIDRPMGSFHPEHKDLYYPINYGYIEGIIATDGEEQDVYFLGISEPVESAEGVIISVIHRKNDTEDKWVAAPEGICFTRDEIERAVYFQEQYFDYEVLM